jgi:hypothetical protein
MRKTTTLIVLPMTGALAGCATRSPSKFLDARTTCEQLAQASASSPDLVSNDYADQCMISRGFGPKNQSRQQSLNRFGASAEYR